MTIPDSKLPYSRPDIPENVGIIKEEGSPEMTPFLLSFARYNEKECNVNAMDAKCARKALKTIKDIGIHIRSFSDFNAKLPKLEVLPIRQEGDYRKLYRGLSDLPDVEIKEAKVDSDKGRLFFFELNKIFYIVAVTDIHYETDKVR